MYRELTPPSLPGKEYIDAGVETIRIVAHEGASFFIKFCTFVVLAIAIQFMRLFRSDPESVAKKHMQNWAF